MMKLPTPTLAALALAHAATTTPGGVAYVLPPTSSSSCSSSSSSYSSLPRRYSPLLASLEGGGEAESASAAIADVDDEDKTFDVVEKFGKGAAKVRALHVSLLPFFCRRRPFSSWNVEAKEYDPDGRM
jgi:hypothetical protein